MSLIDIHTHQKTGAATSLCAIYSDFQNLDTDGVYSLGLHPMMVQSYDAIAIENATEALAKGTEAFAALRMNESIRQALSGKTIESLYWNLP